MVINGSVSETTQSCRVARIRFGALEPRFRGSQEPYNTPSSGPPNLAARLFTRVIGVIATYRWIQAVLRPSDFKMFPEQILLSSQTPLPFYQCVVDVEYTGNSNPEHETKMHLPGHACRI
jgi:hypothetical protein